MKYWDSAEVDKTVHSKLEITRKALSPHIVAALHKGALSDVDIEFCYIPIIMGPDFADLYPARSNFDRKQKKLFHSPQLRYEIFNLGTDAERRGEYLNGMLLACPMLEKIGLTAKQLSDFLTAVKEIG